MRTARREWLVLAEPRLRDGRAHPVLQAWNNKIEPATRKAAGSTPFRRRRVFCQEERKDKKPRKPRAKKKPEMSQAECDAALDDLDILNHVSVHGDAAGKFQSVFTGGLDCAPATVPPAAGWPSRQHPFV